MVKKQSKLKKEKIKMSTEKQTKTIKIVEDACILTSQLKFEDIQLVEKVCPKALTLFTINVEGETEELFKIATGKVANLSKYGITFSKANKAGYATITTLFPENVKNKKQWILDNMTKVVLMLKDIEQNVSQELDKIKNAYNNILEDIDEE